MKKDKPKKYRSIKIYEHDYMKVKKWSAVRDMKMTDIIHLMVEKN